jgi:hypothetical protein
MAPNSMTHEFTNNKIFCYEGAEKNILRMLQSVNLNIKINSESINVILGDSPEAVEEAYKNSIISFNFLSRNKKRVINLYPFNKTCIGIISAQEYTVSLNLIRLDLV